MKLDLQFYSGQNVELLVEAGGKVSQFQSNWRSGASVEVHLLGYILPVGEESEDDEITVNRRSSKGSSGTVIRETPPEEMGKSKQKEESDEEEEEEEEILANEPSQPIRTNKTGKT